MVPRPRLVHGNGRSFSGSLHVVTRRLPYDSCSGCYAYIYFSYIFHSASLMKSMLSSLLISTWKVCRSVRLSRVSFPPLAIFCHLVITSRHQQCSLKLAVSTLREWKNALARPCSNALMQRTVEKLVNVTAHCCLSLAGTSPLTYPRVPALPSTFPTDGWTNGSRLDCGICQLGEGNLPNVSDPLPSSQLRICTHVLNTSYFTIVTTMPR